MLSQVLQIFRDSNPQSHEKLQVVVVDKSYAEITSTESVFCDAKVLLCKMHVLDAFRRSFKGQALSVDGRDALCDCMQSMVHSSTETAYNAAKIK